MTLVELLAGIAIVSILSSIVIAVTDNVRDSAAATSEANAARQMVSAYLLTPMDNKGQYLPGYLDSPRASRLKLVDETGRSISGPDAQRYPWRLLSYMDNNWENFFIGKHRDYLSTNPNAYGRSIFPSLGMNEIFVGGRYGSTVSPPYTTTNSFGQTETAGGNFPRDFWVLRPQDAYAPSKLIVFISTQSNISDTYSGPLGYYTAKPPRSPGGSPWSSYNEDIPANLGNVSLRHNGKAVVANLDGSVELLDEDELKDMRRWSNQAAKYDEPNFSTWSRKN